MLDALIAEARLRWGLDPAAGFGLVAAERLVAVPVEPSLPLLIVPGARLQGGLAPRRLRCRSGAAARPPRPARR